MFSLFGNLNPSPSGHNGAIQLKYDTRPFTTTSRIDQLADFLTNLTSSLARRSSRTLPAACVVLRSRSRTPLTSSQTSRICLRRLRRVAASPTPSASSPLLRSPRHPPLFLLVDPPAFGEAARTERSLPPHRRSSQ